MIDLYAKFKKNDLMVYLFTALKVWSNYPSSPLIYNGLYRENGVSELN